MEETKMPTPTQTKEEDEIDLLDLLLVLGMHKNFIFKFTFFVAFITAIISLILPSVYMAETKFLPPQPQSSSAVQMLTQTVGQLAGVGAEVLGIKTPGDLYAELLKSNTVLDRIIERFNLMNLYEVKYRIEARKRLLDNLQVTVDKKSGIIKLAVYDKDPKRAADMANAFVEELRNLTKNLALTEASQRRLFFEDQLKEAKEGLLKAENELSEFQKKTGAIQVEEQAKTTIMAIATLRAQVTAKEAELRMLKSFMTPDNPEVKKAEEALRALKAELANLERKKGNSPEALIPTGKLPEVGIEYLRKVRNLKFYETLYELMLKAYEAAKLDEAKEAPIIQVIDKATPPEKKAKPKRALMVLVAGISAFFLSVIIAFFKEYIEKSNQDPERKHKIDTLKSLFDFKLDFKKFNLKFKK
jgi:tyrosine-protein kinase Etk/Wzc